MRLGEVAKVVVHRVPGGACGAWSMPEPLDYGTYRPQSSRAVAENAGATA